MKRLSLMTVAKRLRALLLAAGLLVVTMGTDSCSSSLVSDPGFDRWIGNSLAAWTVESGSIRKVPTWHRGDYGVELLGDGTAISQMLKGKSSCFEVSLLADRDSHVTLQLDFNDNGRVEYKDPIQVDKFALATFMITPPKSYSSTRIRLRKIGSGKGVLARVRIEARNREECSAPPIDWCGGTCRADEVCGLDDTSWHAHNYGCVARASKPLGEFCADSDECKSGICSSNLCQGCRSASDCSTYGICGAHSAADHLLKILMPRQCDPGTPHSAGSDCFRDEDCKSGRCLGKERRACSETLDDCSDSGCPTDAGSCELIGIIGGKCE
jgi:hypothetical protein